MEAPITSSHNPQVTRVRKWINRPQVCRRDGVLVADGIHLVQEALEAGLSCRVIFADSRSSHPEVKEILDSADERRLPVYPVMPHILRAVSGVETPQGLIGVFERPAFEPSAFWRAALETSPVHVVVAAGVQDPGNMGSLIRTARAAGIRGLVCTRGTVDPYHHRALRASMGAALSFPILLDVEEETLISQLEKAGLRTAGLAPRGTTDLDEIDPQYPTAWVFGSEGQGLPKDIGDAIDLNVKIPMEPGVESLAVPAAGAVVFYWLYLFGRDKQRNGDGVRADRSQPA